MRKLVSFALALLICALSVFQTAGAQGEGDNGRLRICVAVLSQTLGRQVTLQDYPDALQENGTQGTVMVQLSVDRSGRLRESILAQSSGSPMLDQAALRAVERIFPRSSAAPRECNLGAGFLVTLPLRFGLRDVPRDR